jgi:ATP-binding cassette subfamily B protein
MQGHTCLIIAHRPSTLQGADHIVVLQEGRVAEQGTPELLQARGGWFRKLVENGVFTESPINGSS